MRKQVQFAAMALPAIALLAISAQAQDMTYGQTEDLTPDEDPMVIEPNEVTPPENSMMTEPEEGTVPPAPANQELLRAQAEEVQDTQTYEPGDVTTAQTDPLAEPGDPLIIEPEDQPSGDMAVAEATETPAPQAIGNKTEDFADYGFEDMDTNDDGVLNQEEYVMAATVGDMTSEERAIELFQEAAGDDDRLTYTEFVTPQG